MIDLTNRDKAEVLAALYNASKAQGMGFIHFNPTPMTKEEAQELLDTGQTYFDYLHGQVLKIDLKGNELDTRLYNRDIGPGAAESILDS